MGFLDIVNKIQSAVANVCGTSCSDEVSEDDVSVFSSDIESEDEIAIEEVETADDETIDEDDETIMDLIDEYDSDEWEEVEYTQDTGIFGGKKESYTYTASDGTAITVSNTDGTSVKYNSETGEIVVIGAQDASIESGGGDTLITIYDSEIESIETKKGNDTIKIYNSEVAAIKSGKGIDSITIEDSVIEDINTGSGSDTINASNSTIQGANTSSSFLWGLLDSGDDTVILDNTEADEIKTGKGDDTIIAQDSSINTLNTGNGEDLLSLDETDVKDLGTNKKDTVIEDGNYLDFDISVISEIETDSEITFSDGTTMNVSEYINEVLNQEIGYETEEEYYEYVVETLTSTLETMQSVLSSQNDADGAAADTYNALKELTGLGITSDDIEGMITQMEEMTEGLSAALNGESEMSFEEAYEYYTGVEYSKEKLDTYMEVSNVYSALLIGCQYDEDYAEKFEEATGKSLEDIASEYALCQTETFGNVTTLENLTEAYSWDQETFADKLSTVMTVSGIVLIAAGAVVSFVVPPAGVAMMSAGKTLSLSGMFIDNAIDLVDDSTDADGLTQEEFFDFALETGVEAVSYFSGRVIGGCTSALNDSVKALATSSGLGNAASYILGQAAETTADTILSLAADYGITNVQSLITTGETVALDEFLTVDNLLGEGGNQLLGILTGLSSAKVDAYKASAAAGTAAAAGTLALADIDTAGTVKTVDVDTTKAVSADTDTDINAINTVDTNTKSAEVDADVDISRTSDIDSNISTQRVLAAGNDTAVDTTETVSTDGAAAIDTTRAANIDSTRTMAADGEADAGARTTDAYTETDINNDTDTAVAVSADGGDINNQTKMTEEIKTTPANADNKAGTSAEESTSSSKMTEKVKKLEKEAGLTSEDAENIAKQLTDETQVNAFIYAKSKNLSNALALAAAEKSLGEADIDSLAGAVTDILNNRLNSINYNQKSQLADDIAYAFSDELVRSGDSSSLTITKNGKKFTIEDASSGKKVELQYSKGGKVCSYTEEISDANGIIKYVSKNYDGKNSTGISDVPQSTSEFNYCYDDTGKLVSIRYKCENTRSGIAIEGSIIDGKFQDNTVVFVDGKVVDPDVAALDLVESMRSIDNIISPNTNTIQKVISHMRQQLGTIGKKGEISGSHAKEDYDNLYQLAKNAGSNGAVIQWGNDSNAVATVNGNNIIIKYTKTNNDGSQTDYKTILQYVSSQSSSMSSTYLQHIYVADGTDPVTGEIMYKEVTSQTKTCVDSRVIDSIDSALADLSNYPCVEYSNKDGLGIYFRTEVDGEYYYMYLPVNGSTCYPVDYSALPTKVQTYFDNIT